MFFRNRWWKVANYRSLRPLIFVLALQWSPQKSLQSAGPSLVFSLRFPEAADRNGRPDCHHVQKLVHKPVQCQYRKELVHNTLYLSCPHLNTVYDVFVSYVHLLIGTKFSKFFGFSKTCLNPQ